MWKRNEANGCVKKKEEVEEKVAEERKRNERKEIGLNMATSGRRREQLSFLDAVELAKGLLV